MFLVLYWEKPGSSAAASTEFIVEKIVLSSEVCINLLGCEDSIFLYLMLHQVDYGQTIKVKYLFRSMGIMSI
jgi:hypothetical protein